ncbi:MAG: hypothetical protein WC538_08780 [Thermoanaerobaculia bacterium]|jgi:hypothetical protein
MPEALLVSAISLVVGLILIVVISKAIGASKAVRNELRSHLEREGWSSIHSPFLTLAPGFRGSWQGRDARGSFQARHKSQPPMLIIEVSTRQFERMRIARHVSSVYLRAVSFSFGLPPRVDLGDSRFDARAESRELIELILRDESRAQLFDEFLRASHDRVESKRGTLKLKRELLDRRAPGGSFLTVRPPAEEIERSVFLAHRLLEALSTKGF